MCSCIIIILCHTNLSKIKELISVRIIWYDILFNWSNFDEEQCRKTYHNNSVQL